MSRSVAEIITDLSSFDPSTADKSQRLSHDCYMILVGYLNSNDKLKKLKDMIEQREGSNNQETTAAASIGVVECEEVETILQHITLKFNTEELTDTRRHHFVYEDHFNTALFEYMENSASFEKLKRICRKYEENSKLNVDNVMKEHTDRANKTHSYFVNKGLSEDDALASAFAIAFYTGSRSEACSRGASLVARRANGVAVEQRTQAEMKEASIILYYLVKGLSNIPYHWGYVTRACSLKDNELKLYTPGALVTWLQFSSSKRGKDVAKGGGFENRNTQFKIYSLTGRRIQHFSNYDHEDEVLFLPHSTFLVFKHVTSFHGAQHTIYMRQVELGMSTWSVLWVDDRIFVEDWENKVHMEYAASKALNMNVHFIPKSRTDYAISFLQSPFGQHLKSKDTFRIVTDMNRENEQPVHNAGARLIKQLRQLGFQTQCMVFTSSKRKGDEIMKQELSDQELKNVIVTTSTSDLRRFVNFQ
ncbi:unnamed protein product [Rotaria socialis]|uniref:NAD(P)(+)--arginine ADP-ribosyltransferase n=2 Tax=Rotaria socialis TaxID=392032 RepID=A0A821VAA5_9BILA|nr:unnamed protein product [Rotaria socialis]CAF4905073.1 unnamed protein product [Rotaria socialis]